jgi:acetyl esterase
LNTELADPLLILEQGRAPDRPLPAFFAFAGTRDPVLDDTRRVEGALSALKVPHEVRFYPGELHAFHALMLRKAARDCWRDKLSFLERQLAAATP